MPHRSHSESKCPQCGGALKRRHRASGEPRETNTDFRRYRCTAASCPWDGLLPRPTGGFRRSRGAATNKEAGSTALPVRLWLVMGALFVLLVVGASVLMHMAFRQEPGLLSTGNPLSSATSATPNAAPALQPRK